MRPPTRPRRKLKTALQAAVCHPLRLRVFAMLAERSASPAELGRELGEEVGNVNYHVGRLAEANLVEQVDERQVRGAMEHFYKAIELPYISDEDELEMSDCARESMVETVVAMYAADAAHALRSGTMLSRGDHHLTRTTVRVDAQGWEEMTAAYEELYQCVDRIQAESAERMGESGERPMRALSYQSLFELPLRAKDD